MPSCGLAQQPPTCVGVSDRSDLCSKRKCPGCCRPKTKRNRLKRTGHALRGHLGELGSSLRTTTHERAGGVLARRFFIALLGGDKSTSPHSNVSHKVAGPAHPPSSCVSLSRGSEWLFCQIIQPSRCRELAQRTPECRGKQLGYCIERVEVGSEASLGLVDAASETSDPS